MRIERIGDAMLYLGDCISILPTLDKVDAVVTDPPYGIGLDTDYSGLRQSTRVYDPIEGDSELFDPAPFLKWPAVLFGANHFASRLPDDGTWHVWDKREHAKSNLFADFEIWWTSYNSRPSRIFRYQWICGVHPGIPLDIIAHPTSKPVALMIHVVGGVDGATILDPYMGSGTTGVACANLGRKFIGIEICEQYFDIACERIEAAHAQGRLFA